MIDFSTGNSCYGMNPCRVGIWATFCLAGAVAFFTLLCNFFCPPLMHFFVSDKKHRLHIRRWMRAARHYVDAYHHHHVVVEKSTSEKYKGFSADITTDLVSNEDKRKESDDVTRMHEVIHNIMHAGDES
jgi:hypothetical protein